MDEDIAPAEQEQVPPELLAEMKSELEEATQRARVYAAEGGTLPDRPYADAPIPPELRGEFSKVEQEIVAPFANVASPHVLPIEDLRERLRLLAEASVDMYEDGNLRIKFDIENRRALLKPQTPVERW